jgi:2-polyprenyl-3-methyl-5-hydroxy-6-metoxy-1,4-benzoquinol methylase
MNTYTKIDTCGVCSSRNIVLLDSYKHHVVVCNSCECVSHIKKNKYAIEFFVPRKLAKVFLPRKAFLRLFSDKGDFSPADFYDGNSFETTLETTWRKSEVQQFEDQLALFAIDPKGKVILDVSGGPGLIATYLAKRGAKVQVTEYSSYEVSRMNETGLFEATVFDYENDKIEEKFDIKFDVIMVRSSIIFCSNLSAFVRGLNEILKPGGKVIIETITPSLGEIYWWQQLEYKFPRIYSEEMILKTFASVGLTQEFAYREHGSYMGVKFRSYNTLFRQMFTWLIDFPMVMYYKLKNNYSAAEIDLSLNHKMVTYLFTSENSVQTDTLTLPQGGKYKSKTFGYKYNGYLKSLRKSEN